MEGLSPRHFQLYEIPEIDNNHQRNMVGFLLPVLNYPLNFIPPALSLENHEQVTMFCPWVMCILTIRITNI